MRIITFSGMCTALQVRPRTLRKWIHDGRVPEPIRLSHKVPIWRMETLDEWLEQREAAQAAKEPDDDYRLPN